MTEKIYTIKPLEWEKIATKEGRTSLSARTRLGYYYVVELACMYGDLCEQKPCYHVKGGCFWSYCFGEYNDKKTHYGIESVAAAKKAAEAHWLETMKECLLEIGASGNPALKSGRSLV